MGKAEGSFPSVHDTTTLWQWVKEINKATGSDLRATAHIMGTAWKRAQRSAIHWWLHFGWQQAAFLGKDWMLTVSSNDVKMPKEKNWEAAEKSLKRKCSAEEVTRSVEKQGADAVKKCKETGYNLTRGWTLHKLPFQCSEWYRWNLKQNWKQSCVESLVWLQQKWYSGSKVEIVNRKTGGTEVINQLWSRGFPWGWWNRG